MITWLARRLGFERRNSNPGSWLTPPTQSGVTVTPETAMNFSAVYAAINAISTDVALLPFRVYRRTPTGKVEDRSHPLFDILDVETSPEVDAFHWEQATIAHALSYGSGYSEIVRDGDGEVSSLNLLDPRVTHAVRDDRGRLWYDYKADGKDVVRFASEDILHIKGLAYDGIRGYSPIHLARQSIGLGMAAELFGANFYGNSATPGGFFKMEKKLTAEAMKNFRDEVNQAHGGVYNSHKFGLLEPGMSFLPTTITPEDSQFLATRAFSIVEIARWFNLSPRRLQDLTAGADDEASLISYVSTTLHPWMVAVESEVNRKLFASWERKQWFAAHDVKERLRADTAARTTYYKELGGMGIFSVNEIRSAEGYNPIGASGDLHLYPANNLSPLEDLAQTGTEVSGVEDVQALAMNGAQITSLLLVVQAVAAGTLPTGAAQGMIAASFPNLTQAAVAAILDPLDGFAPSEVPALPAPEPSPTAPSAAVKAIRAVLVAEVGRMVRRECTALRRALRKDDPVQAVEEFYQGHGPFVAESVTPALRAFALVRGIDPPDLDMVENSRAAFLGLLEDREQAERLLVEWETGKAEELVAAMEAA